MKYVNTRFLALAASAVCSTAFPALGQAFDDDFESSNTGAFPSSTWQDLGNFSIPQPNVSSGVVIDTIGANGQSTRAFQVADERTTSQGLFRSIDTADTHRLSADMRIDAFPSPQLGLDWTGAMGFFQQGDGSIDINQQPQAVVLVQSERWLFFGNTTTSNFTFDLLSTTPVIAGDWYNITMEADTQTGAIGIQIIDSLGEMVVDQTITIPNFDPALGAYNSAVFFDGEYSTAFATPGRFTVDNVSYVPAPGVLAAIGGMGLLATRRRR